MRKEKEELLNLAKNSIEVYKLKPLYFLGRDNKGKNLIKDLWSYPFNF